MRLKYSIVCRCGKSRSAKDRQLAKSRKQDEAALRKAISDAVKMEEYETAARLQSELDGVMKMVGIVD